MVALSLVAVTGPVAVTADDHATTDHTVETLENDEDLYLSFGADLGDKSLDEYIEAHADDNPSDDGAEIIQYQDVEQVNIHEQGAAVSVAIGGGEATAMQEVSQTNTNLQNAEAETGSEIVDQETTFEDVGDVYVIMGNGDDQTYDGYGIVDGGDASVTQAADAAVSQTQEVAQANVNQNNTALAYAEDESDATALQLTEQSNLNLQEGAANATNVFAGDLDSDTYDDRTKKQKEYGDTAVPGDQAASASVNQSQDVEQVNSDEQGTAVAIAVGENATATALQFTDQSNVNEQLGTTEAINTMMGSAGMYVATAGVDGGNDVIAHDEMEKHEPEEKKSDGEKPGEVTQSAAASVTQYQSVEQVNLNVNSTAQAVATDGSEALAVQLTFQQNVNAQLGYADTMNILTERTGEDGEKKYDEAADYDGYVLTETTAAAIGDDPVDDVDRTSFEYDGDNDQLNDVDQYTTADIEQSQTLSQLSLSTDSALAISEDGGDAAAFQMTIQENENIQIAEEETTTIEEGAADTSEGGATDASDEETATPASEDSDDTASADDSTASLEAADDGDDDTADDDEMPGFGIAVALVALLGAAMIGLRE